MKRCYRFEFLVLSAVMATSFTVFAADDIGVGTTVGIVGTGDMGDSPGPRFAELGYRVVYGSRNPDSEKVRNLGSLDGKIVIDMSMPVEQAEDGYYISMVETSSAEMIRSWNPGTRVVKAFATQASYVVDDPDAADRAVNEQTGMK